MNWDLSNIADHLADSLAAAEADLRLEQAVYGLDSLDERRMQALLADRLAARYAVTREVHYPDSRGKKMTHRARCDLVLAPPGRPVWLDTRPPGLFDAPNPCPPGEALWLEVKVAAQFREGNVRHGGYGPQWRQAVVEDLRKMSADTTIREAALVLIVFNESEAVLQKDVELFEDLLMRKEVLAGFRQVRSIRITERIGHHLCTVALWPTIQRI